MEEAQKYLVPRARASAFRLLVFESLDGLVFVYGTDPVDDITKTRRR
jgi:hypothetical protein